MHDDGRAGIEDFCKSEFPKLVEFLTVYTGDQFTAEDLAQETLARAWGRGATFRSLIRLHCGREEWRSTWRTPALAGFEPEDALMIAVWIQAQRSHQPPRRPRLTFVRCSRHCHPVNE